MLAKRCGGQMISVSTAVCCASRVWVGIMFGSHLACLHDVWVLTDCCLQAIEASQFLIAELLSKNSEPVPMIRMDWMLKWRGPGAASLHSRIYVSVCISLARAVCICVSLYVIRTVCLCLSHWHSFSVWLHNSMSKVVSSMMW